MRAFGKVLMGSALALTMVAGDAASARPWGNGGYGRGHGGYRYHGRSNFGDFLLGVGVIGAIAAIASSGSRDKGNEVHTTRDDPPPAPRGEFPFDLDAPRDGPRNNGASASPARYERDAAVDACKVAAEREGERYSSRVNIGQIEDVSAQKDGGYRVTGVADIDKGGYNGSSKAGDIEHARFDCTSAGGKVVSFRFGSSAELAQRY